MLKLILIIVFAATPLVSAAAATNYHRTLPGATVNSNGQAMRDARKGGASPLYAVTTREVPVKIGNRRVEMVVHQSDEVPAADAPDCNRACGNNWEEKARGELARKAKKRCGENYACLVNATRADNRVISTLANLQSYAGDGTIWAAMTPCTVMAGVEDGETLTRYVYADETANPTGGDTGLVTRKGRQSGNMKSMACAMVLDNAYTIYLTAPRKAHNYIVQIPRAIIPVEVESGDGSEPESDRIAGFDPPDGHLRFGDPRRGAPLPRPALGQPFAGSRHIEALYALDSSPVFHRNLRIPVSAGVTWRFTPAPDRHPRSGRSGR